MLEARVSSPSLSLQVMDTLSKLQELPSCARPDPSTSLRTGSRGRPPHLSISARRFSTALAYLTAPGLCGLRERGGLEEGSSNSLHSWRALRRSIQDSRGSAPGRTWRRRHLVCTARLHDNGLPQRGSSSV